MEAFDHAAAFDLEVWRSLCRISTPDSLGSLDVLEEAGCPQAGSEALSPEY